MRQTAITTAILCVSIGSSAFAQTVQKAADSVMALNRSGHWAQAEVLATKSLQTFAAARERVARCQMVEGLAYAQLRNQRPAGAASTLKVFDGACATVPEMRGFAKEVAAMRREINTKVSPRKT